MSDKDLSALRRQIHGDPHKQERWLRARARAGQAPPFKFAAMLLPLADYASGFGRITIHPIGGTGTSFGDGIGGDGDSEGDGPMTGYSIGDKAGYCMGDDWRDSGYSRGDGYMNGFGHGDRDTGDDSWLA